MRKAHTVALEDFRKRANTLISIKQGAEMTDLVKAADASNDTIMTWLVVERFAEAAQEYNVSSSISAAMRVRAKKLRNGGSSRQESERTRRGTASFIWMALIGGSLLTTAGAILGGVVLTRGIAALTKVVTNLEQIALDEPVERRAPRIPRGSRTDEIGTLTRAMQTMTVAGRR